MGGATDVICDHCVCAPVAIAYLVVQPVYEGVFDNGGIKSLGLNIHAPTFSHQLTKNSHELICKLEGILGGRAFACHVWHMATQTLQNWQHHRNSPWRLGVVRDLTRRHTVPVGTSALVAHHLFCQVACVCVYRWFWSMCSRVRMLCSTSKFRVCATMAPHIVHTEKLTDPEVSLNHDALSQDVNGISSILPPIDNMVSLHSSWRISYTIIGNELQLIRL